jgi:hypothetical protein
VERALEQRLKACAWGLPDATRPASPVYGRHAESPSLVLVINDTNLLMSYVKWFELGISNTHDEGACGMK